MDDSAKRAVCAAVDRLAPMLVRVSHDIHSRPETAFGERHAARLLAAAAGRHGLPAGVGAGGIATAVCADAGRAGPRVALLAEYDALPGLGHACGHNVVAAAALGAALALAPVADRYGGRVRLLGTPAEEGGGGKVLLARAGLLRDVAVAMLVHPNAYETATPHLVAAAMLDVTTVGKAAHASLFPERGVNALDGLVLGYLGLAVLRPHLPRGDLVSAVLTSGGTAANVIPDRAAAKLVVRSPTAAGLRPLRARVEHCLRAAAAAVGADLRVREASVPYDEARPNPPLAAAYAANARALGRRPLPPRELPAWIVGSSDLGTVSHVVPAIHPMLRITAGDPVPHTAGFAAAAVGPAADRAVVDGAKALAMTALDVWRRPHLRAAVRRAFEEGAEHGGNPA